MPKKKKTTGKFLQDKNPIDSYYKDTAKNRTKGGTGAKAMVIFMTIVCMCIGVFACITFMGEMGLSFDFQLPALGNRVAEENIRIAGVDITGLTKEEAIAAVSEEVGNRFSTDSMVITVLDKELELSPAVTGAYFDVEAAVKDAFQSDADVDADGNFNILPYLSLNTDAIRQKIKDFAGFFPTEGVQSGWETVANEDGTEVLKITIGTEYYDFNEDAFYEAVLQSYNSCYLRMNYTCNQLNVSSIDLDAIYAETCTESVEAILDPQTHEVTQSSAGYRFDLEAAREALAAAQPGDVLAFPYTVVEPEMTTEQLQSMLYRDKLGSYTASSSSSYNRDTNLRLACEAINGTILYPGDTFSYNQALGERTAAKGYKPAASYVNGETVQTYGGGICQPSSSLYYAALIADLEIVQRECHSYVSSYMPLGMDATVDWNGPDFKFRNNTDFPIRIDATANGGTVTVTLIGTDTKDYYVEMEYEVLSTSYPTTKEEIVEAGSGHSDGEVKTSSYTGYQVQTYKLKYSKETDTLISREKEAYSNYAKRDKVIYRIKQAATTPTTEPTSDPTTAPTTVPTTAPTTTPTTTPTTAPTTEPTTAAPEPPTTEPPATTPPISEAGGDVEIPTNEE